MSTFIYGTKKLVPQNIEKTDVFFELVDLVVTFIEQNRVTGYYEYNFKKYESLASAVEALIDNYIDDDPDYFEREIKDSIQESIDVVEIYFPQHADWLFDDDEE